jgi:hypothetical protein
LAAGIIVVGCWSSGGSFWFPEQMDAVMDRRVNGPVSSWVQQPGTHIGLLVFVGGSGYVAMVWIGHML